MLIGRWLLLHDIYSFRDYMLNFIDTSSVDINVLQEVLKSMKNTIEEPKSTRTDELLAEAKILKQLYDFFNVPQNLLKISNSTTVNPPKEEYTEYFAIVMADNSTLNAMEQVLSRVAERVAYELLWNEHTFRGKKSPKDVLLKKLLSIQKNESYLYKGRLAELCLNLEGRTERIGQLRDKLIYHVQNMRKLQEESEIAEELLPKKIKTAESYRTSIDNPDVLESIKDYMLASLPKLEIEIGHLKRKIEYIDRGMTFIRKDFQELNAGLEKELNELNTLINSKPISLWPKKEKTDLREFRKRLT